MQQHNQFKNVFLSTFIGTESHDSNMLQPIVSDSTRCLRIIDSQNFMKNNLLAQEQQNINYHNSNNESNFSFVYPNQYIKEFPNIYPSVTRIEMDKLNKTNYDSSLPCVEDLCTLTKNVQFLKRALQCSPPKVLIVIIISIVIMNYQAGNQTP